MRNLLCEVFTTDNSLKLINLQHADCIVYASVIDVQVSRINWSNDLQPNEWSCNVTIKYSVILPGIGKPLIDNSSVSGSANFTSGPDFENVNRYGMRQKKLSLKSIRHGKK